MSSFFASRRLHLNVKIWEYIAYVAASAVRDKILKYFDIAGIRPRLLLGSYLKISIKSEETMHRKNYTIPWNNGSA